MDAWKTLVEKYADGRPICNCGNAYYSPCGEGLIRKDGEWIKKNDLLVCAYGCSSAQIDARDYIAKRILEA